MKRLVLHILLCLCWITFDLSAQTVKVVDVYSPKMGRNIKTTIVLPAGYDVNSDKRYPVVYLLNGHGGNHMTFVSRIKTTLPEDAEKWNMIFVCPDGQDSWYWDSPIDPTFQFETFVSRELTGYVDANYKTRADAVGRAVTGFSMGGHGGLWLGIRHPDIFGACGSMSGGVDIRPFPNNWDMEKRLGKYLSNKEVWDNHTVINQLNKINPDSLSIIIDCGVGDFFYQVNEGLHKKMLEKKIPHDYIVRPGKHDGTYWNNALDYQLLFFYKFFYK